MRQRIKIYLDTSVYNRPFDDQSQARIRLEAEAFLSILEKTMAGGVSIISSSVVAYENSMSLLSAKNGFPIMLLWHRGP